MQRLELLALAGEPAEVQGRSTPTLEELVDRAVERGVVKQIIYSRRVLRQASHSSIKHLHQRTQTFMAQRNQTPKPSKWTFVGFKLQTGKPLRVKDDANVRHAKKSR